MRRWIRLAVTLTAFLLPFGAVQAADVIFLSAHTTFATANPGGANEGTCFIGNETGGDIRVRLDVRVVFADGKVQRLTGIPDPGVIGADGAYELNVFFIVPPTAALGTGQFVCDATAQSLVTRRDREVEVQSAPFEVVP